MHNINVTINDTSNNKNSTVFYVNVSAVPYLNISLNSPANNTINTTSNTILFNYNISANSSAVSRCNLTASNIYNDSDYSLVAVYHLDNNLNDALGRNNATCTSCPTYTTSGKYRGAYSFDGIDDTTTIAQSTSLNHNGDYTIAAWLKMNNWVNYANIFAKSDYGSGGATQYQMQFSDAIRSRAIYCYAGGDGGVGSRVDSNADFITDADIGNWVFAVITQSYNAGTTTVEFYKNGTLFDSRTASGKTGNAASSAGLVNYLFDGVVDEVRIYNRSLTASEINSLYGITYSDYYNSSSSISQNNNILSLNLSNANYNWNINCTSADTNSIS